MPEGHVLHRAARLRGKRFAGQRVAVTSPQGRFEEGAARLNGATLEHVSAKGKHIFYGFDTDETLHVHLGLFGKFRVNTAPFPTPSPNCRVLMQTDHDELHLAGPNQCRLLDNDGVQAALDRLGPDPIINAEGDRDEFIRRIMRRKIPIGRAIMDQAIMAGVGNVYRSELLFLTGVHPWTVAREVDEDTLARLWDRTVLELKAGERAGRIITVDIDDVEGDTRSKLKRGERLYAYKRLGEPCRRCGDTIRSANIDGRNAWWCPTCQPDA